MHNLDLILFLDIETVPQYSSYSQCPEELKALWSRKAENLKKQEAETAEDIYNRAGIYAEFGKIVCISTGLIRMQDGVLNLRIKSFFNNDEKNLLEDFSQLLNKHFSKSDNKLCAHNGKEFDFPYIARRMIINEVQ